jgi:hypothetical protein
MFVNSEVGKRTENILYGFNLANNLSICTQRFAIFSVSIQNSEVNNTYSQSKGQIQNRVWGYTDPRQILR